MIVESTYTDVWQNCLTEIKSRTSEDEFIKWFKPIVPISFDGTTLRVRVPDQGYVQHIERNYITFLRPIIRNLFGLKTRLSYAIPSAEFTHENSPISDIAQADSNSIKNPFIIPGLKRIVFDPNLNSEYSFDNYVEGECNRLARSAGMAVAVNPGKTSFNPLFIYGNSGLGKTHLAQAIGLETKARYTDSKVLYVSANKFQTQFTSANKRGGINDFMHFYQMIDVLIIDDIHELAGKPGTQNVFFNIFNHLHLLNKQLILTSDRPPVELEGMEERLITRFKWGLATQLVPPDYETKVKILRSKAASQNIGLSEEIIEFLASNINANIREMEGALTSIAAHARFMGRGITISLVKEVLRDIVKVSNREITTELIINTTCEYMNISHEMFSSKKRTYEIVQARQIAMFLSKKHTKASLVAIGLAVGGKHHATVVHACKTIQNLIDTDKIIRRQIEEIEKALNK